jgi:glycosyltransferase involved in cell wall biosynthesis
MGYAYPYYIYTESPFFNLISYKSRIKISLHKLFHKFYLERNGKHYVCETNDVANRLTGYIKSDPGNVYTVTNSYNHFFRDFKPGAINLLPKQGNNEFRFVTLSSFANHKNLIILNKVIPILKEKYRKVDFKFVVTVDNQLFQERFSDSSRTQIINLGRIRADECPQIYYECDAMFLPTLMECFSASYAESMKMGKPIVTSDLAFARTVCDDAALYFNPMDPADIAEKIATVAKNIEFREKMVKKGYVRLSSFDTPEKRAEKYLEICKLISIK